MKKRIALYGIIIAAISYGNAFGATTISRCCSGTTCANSYIEGCKSCFSDVDCGGNSGCTDCNSTNWAATGTEGYESRINATCMILTGKCNKTTEYRCAKNWFGSPTSDSVGCNRCWKEAGAVTKEAGSTQATDCYIPKNTSFSDSSGNGIYTDDCYYTN